MTDQQDQQPATPVFNIEKIFVKDLSLEVPNAPAVFLEREAPQIDLQITHQSNQVEEGIYQTVLTLTVTAKVQDKTAFLVELQQAGVFRIQNVPPEALEPALAVGCPSVLYPYAREVISDAVTKAGFPPLLLQPMNFEMLYMQQKQAAQTQQPQQTH